ncbi:ribonuclease H-like domain-containing protein [Tanacetum coccineum]
MKIKATADLLSNIDAVVDEKTLVMYAINGLGDLIHATPRGVAFGAKCRYLHTHDNKHVMQHQSWNGYFGGQQMVRGLTRQHVRAPRPAYYGSSHSQHAFGPFGPTRGILGPYPATLTASLSGQDFGPVSLYSAVIAPKTSIRSTHPPPPHLLFYYLPPNPRGIGPALLLLLYVDDIILTASFTRLLQRIISSLDREFSMTGLGPLNYFLDISSTCTPMGMFLSQSKYTIEILERANMINCKPCKTQVNIEKKLGPDGLLVANPTLYRSLAGTL